MRKTKIVNGAYGRDVGKLYMLTEMPALRGEKWAMNVFMALKGTSGEIPADVSHLGIVGVAIAGINAFLKSDVDPNRLSPLLDEMLTCVKIIRDPSAIDHSTGTLVATELMLDSDVEEIVTLALLRSEVLELHTNFSVVDAILKLWDQVRSPQLETSPKL